MILTGLIMIVVCALGFAVLTGLLPGVKSLPIGEGPGFGLMTLFAFGLIAGVVCVLSGAW